MRTFEPGESAALREIWEDRIWSARPVTVVAISYVLTGTAEEGSLVRIYRDSNRNGRLDAGDVLVTQVQLEAGSTAFSLGVPLIRRANNFLVTAANDFGSQSAPAVVPTIRQLTIPVVARVRFASGWSYVRP